MIETDDTTRRDFLVRAVGAAAGASVLHVSTTRSARATPEMMEAEIRKIIGSAKLNHGRVLLDIPQLVENGNTVPMSIKIDSTMTEADHVQAIHVFNEKNPQTHVVSVNIGPRAGRAQISTRVKLADTQNVVAVAQMSDGTFWSGTANVIVTIAACLEDL